MRPPLPITAVFLTVFVLYSCSGIRSAFQPKTKIYQPPRIGAEHRFEDGLRREKHPQNLFSKKERREMEKMGRVTEKDRSAPNTRISTMQADSILTGKTRDTTSTVAADSSQVIPADTSAPVPVDTTRQLPNNRGR